MKDYKPGDMFNKMKAKQAKKKTLRSPDAVVKSEQNASHQYYKRKMTNIGITKRGGKRTNIGIMKQTDKQTSNRRKITNKGMIKKPGNNGKTNIGLMGQTRKQTAARKKTAMDVSKERAGKIGPALRESMRRAGKLKKKATKKKISLGGIGRGIQNFFGRNSSKAPGQFKSRTREMKNMIDSI